MVNYILEPTFYVCGAKISGMNDMKCMITNKNYMFFSGKFSLCIPSCSITLFLEPLYF